jgi:hypothetical protein
MNKGMLIYPRSAQYSRAHKEQIPIINSIAREMA